MLFFKFLRDRKNLSLSLSLSLTLSLSLARALSLLLLVEGGDTVLHVAGALSAVFQARGPGA